MLTEDEESLLAALQDAAKLAEIITVLRSNQLLPELQGTHFDMQ